MTILFRREIALNWASGGAITALLFFFVVMVSVPFAVGPNPVLLSTIAAAVLWVAALLAGLLGLDRLFQADSEDGTLDLYLTSGRSLTMIVAIKSLAHWCVTGLPMVIAVPVFALILSAEPVQILATMATLLVGTPAISFIGSVGAATTVSLPRGGLVLSVLILPLVLPVLIFGVGAVRAAATEPDPFLPPFLLVCALSLFFAALGPVAAAYALRAGRD